MMQVRPAHLLLLGSAALAAAFGVRAVGARAQTPAPAAAQQTLAVSAATPEFFEARMRPILAANCYECHADGDQGGLRLDSRESMLSGGESGPAIVPGKPDESLLIKAVERRRASRRCRTAGRS